MEIIIIRLGLGRVGIQALNLICYAALLLVIYQLHSPHHNESKETISDLLQLIPLIEVCSALTLWPRPARKINCTKVFN